MNTMCKNLILFFFLGTTTAMQAANDTSKINADRYRPLIHFAPKAHWMNDPNGMVYTNGVYHLFYQHYPGGTVWGPMHWGHATSPNLVNWQEQPIALYPDSIGMIFSGSAVVDATNTSGFGKGGKAPLVAIYTQHNMEEEKSNTSDTFQTQSIAYSNDDGNTWTKYSNNPVLRNPGIRDFRDPKVMWYAPTKRWLMTLATKDRVTFYSSPNLKDWTRESDFGATVGGHGGVWECPDLVEMTDASGRKSWVLIVSINPAGPNGGSATQYFVGHFDGHQFTSTQTKARWIDYGPDDYAGITWSNTDNRKMFLGWMSNWDYANEIPTDKEGWRNAMTVPRELKLMNVGDETYVASELVAELNTNQSAPVALKASGSSSISIPSRMNVQADAVKDFSLRLYNAANEELLIGYDAKAKTFFLDRTRSGKTDFKDNFARKATAPRLATGSTISLSLVLDNSSVELFADNGLTAITSLFFANEPYNKIESSGVKKLEIMKLKPAPVTMVKK
jgi:fructan beta-fructosidase